MRQDKDSMGPIDVPESAYWGAATARSLKYFAIGEEVMPFAVISALALLKSACAEASFSLGNLSKEKKEAIQKAAQEIIEGKLKGEFPLHVWQTGSGTQSNMNVNEVIANRANQVSFGEKLGTKKPIHPNDDVNLSQSSNDTFPTAMHMAAVLEIREKLLPALKELIGAFDKKVDAYKEIVKIGRTHLMDAVPLTLGQEFSGYSYMLKMAQEQILSSLKAVQELAIGGTAVGTGLNAPKSFAEKVADILAKQTGIAFTSSPNKFAALASHEPLLCAHSALKTCASALFKIASDIRLMGSGPRSGLAELSLPENEPGSSIMPGKVNPTQCEALTMCAIQVMGNDTAITFAGSQGHFELNVFKPLIIYNFLQSVRLLTDSMASFKEHCLDGLEVNKKKMQEYVERSLMLVTALTPKIGYEKAAEIAKKAHKEETTLKQAALSLNYLKESEFDALIIPKNMTN